MTRKMVSLQISEETATRLSRAAADLEVGRSTIIRWAIGEYLAEHEDRMTRTPENHYRKKEVSEDGNP